jgi:hypothetical protein
MFAHPALSQLTSLDFHATRSEYFYGGLKRDLVSLLIRSPALTCLRIYRGPVAPLQHYEYPEMLEQFQKNVLPHLETLILASRTHLFTRNELKAWGSDVGWPNLSYLCLSRASDLMPFISKVPCLVHLNLTAENGVGMDDLDEHLKSSEGAPLGPVTVLMYSHFIHHLPRARRYQYVTPWCIINSVSETLAHYITCT